MQVRQSLFHVPYTSPTIYFKTNTTQDLCNVKVGTQFILSNPFTNQPRNISLDTCDTNPALVSIKLIIEVYYYFIDYM